MAKRKTPLTDILPQVVAARRRELRERDAGRRALSASYDRRSGRIMLELSNGYSFGFPAVSIPALATASTRQLDTVTVSPGGSALRWDELDADLSVPGLLLACVGRSAKLRELARVAGATKSAAKTAASRANGAKGGRPRKATSR